VSTQHGDVLRVADLPLDSLQQLLGRYGLQLVEQPHNDAITGSYWGDAEAGVVGLSVFVRPDTPLHSLLHETCHVICMDEQRRTALRTDAGGDDLEEAAVCYLQIILAAQLDALGSDRLMRDMDTWGYSFRLGSTRRWWLEDADDARSWLIKEGLLTEAGAPIFVLRGGV
jgi:hypothetical protein